MLKAISNSSSALRGCQQTLAVTANNISNVNTVAYREKNTSFHELPYRTLMERRLPQTGSTMNAPHSGKGVAASGITTSLKGGIPLYTGKQFDLIIRGGGYFRINMPDGSHAYTRSGNFNLDQQGNLCMPGGGLLDLTLQLTDLGEEIDPSNIIVTPEGIVCAPSMADDSVEEEGKVSVLQETSGENGEETPAGTVKLGEVRLYYFMNSQGLMSRGGNLFLPTEASGPPIEAKPGEGLGQLQQGYLEGSNVDLGQQMTALIQGQRFLQASARALITGDELWAITLNMLA